MDQPPKRIQHKHASYKTGKLLCIVCHLTLNSESLWTSHLRSAGHALRLGKFQEAAIESNNSDTITDSKPPQNIPNPIEPPAPDNKKKRRISNDSEGTTKKRRKASMPLNTFKGLPDGFFDQAVEKDGTSSEDSPASREMTIPSRPATPAKEHPPAISAVRAVDEDEWAAFEADIASTVPDTGTGMGENGNENGVTISAPALSKAEIADNAAKESREQRKAREEAEREGDEEDIKRKVEVELEEMEGLEQRVRKMRERREALRSKGSGARVDVIVPDGVLPVDKEGKEEKATLEEGEEEDEEDEELDDWDGFMFRG